MSRPLLFAAVVGILLAALAGCAPDSTTQFPTQPSSAETFGIADGYVPVGDTVALGDDVPAIANLDPVLRDALVSAAAAATDRDMQFTFTEAWRSTRYQQYLFDVALTTYGNEAEARRWVKPADESQHVLGLAVDVATADAMDWLNRFGAEFGLCQIYANEPWHFERVDGVTETCPTQLTDGKVS